MGSNATIGTVRGYQTGHGRQPAQQQGDKHPQHAPPEPALFGRIGIGQFLATNLSANPGHDVLHHAQRTDDGAVYTTEDEGQQQQGHNDNHVQSEHSGQKLYLRHPCQPVVGPPGEVEQQEGHSHKEKGGKSQSDSSQHHDWINKIGFLRYTGLQSRYGCDSPSIYSSMKMCSPSYTT